MSEQLDRFLEDVRASAAADLVEAFTEVVDQLGLLERRNLVACESGPGEPASVIVKGARGRQTIMSIGGLGTVDLNTEPHGIDVAGWRKEGSLVDPELRHDVVAYAEAEALRLLRERPSDRSTTEQVLSPEVRMNRNVKEHTGKYKKLWRWLLDQDADIIPMTFEKVESILGEALPPSSRNYPAHWSGYDNSAVSRAIVDAGFKTRKVDITGETVEMYRA